MQPHLLHTICILQTYAYKTNMPAYMPAHVHIHTYIHMYTPVQCYIHMYNTDYNYSNSRLLCFSKHSEFI